MAYGTDLLKERRKKKGMVPDQGATPDKGADGGGSDNEPSDRSIQLSDSELKALSGTYQPGEEAECLVKGRIDKDGTLDVISVEPANGGGQQKPPMMPQQPPMMGGMPGMMG